MACNTVTNGRILGCKSSVGGIRAVYFSPYSSTTADLTVTAGEVTLAGADFYKYEVKGNSNLETAINSSREAGTTFYESTVTLTLTHLDLETQEQVKLLAHGRPQIVVEDYNGNAFLVGKENGCDISGGSITTGSAMGDMSGFTLTFVAQEVAPPFWCTAAPADASTTPIDPS